MASIADVYVTVLPETGKIADGIKHALLQADKHVVDAAKRWKKEIETTLKGIETHVSIKVDTKQAKKEIEEAAKDQTVAVEAEVDKPSVAKTETVIKTVTRDRTVKIKAEVDKGSLAKATAQLRSHTGFGKGAGIPIPGARGALPPALAIEAIGIAPSVVPLIGSMVQSVGQLSGALGLIPAVAGAAGLAIGSITVATMGFGDAIKNIGDVEKFNESVAKLAPSMQTAARGIQTLMPQISQLQQTVANAFGAGFADQVTKLGDTYLPIFQKVMSQMSGSAGKTLGDIGKMLQTPEMQEDIKTFGANASSAFATLLQAAQPLVKAFTDIAVVGSSFLPQLAGTVADLAKRFGDFIGEARDSGKLGVWIQNGITAFTQLKDIAVNVWDIFKGIFQAADGGNFLETVVDLTTRWSSWINSVEGQNSLSEFFNEAKASLSNMWPIIRDTGIALYNAFLGMKDVVDTILPVIRDIASWMARNEELCYLIGAAIAGWKLNNVVTDIAKIAAALTGLGPTAAAAGSAAGTGVATNFTSKLGAAGFLLRGGAWVLPLTIAYTILYGDTANQPVPPGAPGGQGPPGSSAPQPGLFGDDWASGAVTTDVNGNPIAPAPPGGPPAGTQEPFYLPNQNRGMPPRGTTPGQTTGITSTTPGAVPQPGGGGWMIPYLVPDRLSTGGRFQLHPPSASSGGREPDQNMPFNPPAPVVPDTPGVVPGNYAPTPPGSGSGSGGSAPTPVAPPGMSYDYTGFGELNWNALAELESGNNPQAISKNGKYKGLYQFDDPTWLSVGGDQFAPTADQASESDQKKAAIALYNSRGTAPWPVNGWVLEATDDQLRAAGLTAAGNRRSSSSGGGYSTGNGYSGGSRFQPQPYGLPGGTGGAGGYGSGLPESPWAQSFGAQFGVIPNTRAGHQETNRSEPGFAPNPQGLNRGIDWTGTPAQMRQMAEYLMQHPEFVEQLIYADPETGKHYEIAGGRIQPGYYGPAGSTLGGHDTHVHTRQSQTFPGPQDSSGGGYGMNNVYGDSRDNPMYVSETNPQTYGQQFAQDLVSGFAEIFGLGDIFKNPLDFTMFKTFKSLMGVLGGTGEGGGQNGGQTNNPLTNMLSALTNPNGSDNTTVAQDLMPGGGSGAQGGSNPLTNMLSALMPQVNGGNNNNSGNFSMVVNNPSAKADTPFIMDQTDNYLQSFKRNTGQ